MPPEPQDSPTPVPGQPRARGRIALSLCRSARGTEIARLHHSGAMKALFPREGGTGLRAVLINTAGGVTGGDSLGCRIRAGAGTSATITTQGAERAYRALPGQSAMVDNRLRLDAGARLRWLPQETILFRGASFRRRLLVEMAEDAALLLAEPVVFGRAAMGERLEEAAFEDRLEIRRNGRLIWLESLRMHGDIAARLARRYLAGGAGAMAGLVYVAPDAPLQLERLRALLPETAGASMPAPDMVILRLLARDGYLMRRALIPILALLTDDDLPRSWAR